MHTNGGGKYMHTRGAVCSYDYIVWIVVQCALRKENSCVCFEILQNRLFFENTTIFEDFGKNGNN